MIDLVSATRTRRDDQTAATFPCLVALIASIWAVAAHPYPMTPTLYALLMILTGSLRLVFAFRQGKHCRIIRRSHAEGYGSMYGSDFSAAVALMEESRCAFAPISQSSSRA